MTRQDLIALIRHSGLRRAPRRRPRRMLPPDAIRLRYFAALRSGFLHDLRELIRNRLIPRLQTLAANVSALRQDAGEFDDGDLHDTLEQLADQLAEKWTARRFAQVVQPFAQDTARYSREQLIGVMRDQIGIDVLASEPWLQAEVSRWTSQNVALIKTVPQTFFADIERRLVDGLHSGERWENLADMLEERMGVAESRANLIARDQVGKLFGQLNEKRQTELGVTGYVWRTVHDNRVRELHEDRDGQHFDWNDPPEETPDDGHPGTPIQCRCYAEPDLTEIFGEALSEPS